MLGKCFFILCALSFVCGIAGENMAEVSNAVLDGASAAVELTLVLVGNMCLWCGMLEVLRHAGITRAVAGALSPLLRHVFPSAWKNKLAREEITAFLAANMLGMGNAATPFGMEAMRKLKSSNAENDTATDDMVTLAVLGTASVNLLPTALVALRRSAGAAAPFEIILPVWICSGACSLFAVVLCRSIAGVKRQMYKIRSGAK